VKVCLVSSTYHPTVGGAETYARTIAEAVAAAGHDVTVLTDGARLGLPSEEDLGGVRVVRLTEYQALLEAPDKVVWEQLAFALLDEAAQHLAHAPDIVHANSQETALLGSMIALHHDVPLVCSYHEQEPEQAPFGVGRCRLVYSYLPVDLFLAGSRFYRDRALAFGAGDDRIRLVYLGIDGTVFCPGDRSAARRELGIPDDALLVVCAARLSKRKGLLELVQAVDAAQGEVPGLRVVIAGTANSGSRAYADELFAEIESRALGDAVEVRETLTLRDMPTLFRAADVVVQPSLAEGLGLALLEGMACGAPVVGTDIPGIQEIVTHGRDGLLVSPGKPEPLAAALVRVLSEPDLSRELAAGGLALVGDRFDVRRTAAETLDAYESVVARRAAKAAR
jgi:glycosyltransferase involved in cell wall biosynthesis